MAYLQMPNLCLCQLFMVLTVLSPYSSSAIEKQTSHAFFDPGIALAVVDMCLLWNSVRFMLEPNGEGSNMPPLEVVFTGHGAVAAALAASCAAFTVWACASIGTTIDAHTLLTGAHAPLPRSLMDYLQTHGVTNICIRHGNVPSYNAGDFSSLNSLCCVEVDAKTLCARLMAGDAVECVWSESGKSDDSNSMKDHELLLNSLARCSLQRLRGYK
jgi:hypothetical protein